eukprot:403346083
MDQLEQVSQLQQQIIQPMENQTKDEKLMMMAVEQAQIALDVGEVPVGCVFYHEPSDKVIAKSHNLTNQTKNATTHCEINCINQLSDKNEQDFLKECTLYVTVEPCIMCAYALNLAGIKNVVFGCENDKFGGNGSILSLHQLNNKYHIKKGVLKDQAINLLQRFYEHGNEKAPENKRQRKI